MWELIKFSADPNLNHDAKTIILEVRNSFLLVLCCFEHLSFPRHSVPSKVSRTRAINLLTFRCCSGLELPFSSDETIVEARKRIGTRPVLKLAYLASPHQRGTLLRPRPRPQKLELSGPAAQTWLPRGQRCPSHQGSSKA